MVNPAGPPLIVGRSAPQRLVNIPFLLDGPLMTAPERRRAVVEAMAADLFATDDYRDPCAARQRLHRLGYPDTDVRLLADEACELALIAMIALQKQIATDTTVSP